MHLWSCVLMSVLLSIADGFHLNGTIENAVPLRGTERLLVFGSDESISASVGEDVTLNCSVDSHITPEHIGEVSWRKTDEDGDILVLLYQNNEALQEASNERYRDRVEFFTDEIPKGNFSLRLKRVRTEDKGVYMCLVFAGGLSANATVVLERLGFSAQHIKVLILCILASVSALLLCIIIYCKSRSINRKKSKSRNKDSIAIKRLMALGFLHALAPNIMMSVAFLIWGLAEGSLYETVSCCFLYIVRPLMLIYVAPYLRKMPESLLQFEFAFLMLTYFAVLLKKAAGSIAHYTESDRVAIMFLFGVVIGLFLMHSIVTLHKKCKKVCTGSQDPEPCEDPQSSCPITAEDGPTSDSNPSREQPEESNSVEVPETPEIALHEEIRRWLWRTFKLVADLDFLILPSLLFILMFAAFGTASEGFFLAIIFPVLFFLAFSCLTGVHTQENRLLLFNKSAWIIFMIIMTAVMLYFYIATLKSEKDGAGWICVAVFQQVLWMVVIYIKENEDLDHLYRDILYVCGSVVVILLNAVTLMIEVILKTVNGKRVVGDLRVTVFSSESIFAFSLLILLMFGSWISDIKCLHSRRKAADERNLDSQNAADEQQPVNNPLEESSRMT